MIEIDTWASSETKTILITQDVLGGSTYSIRCRKFIPMEGDSLARKWKKNGAPIHYERAPYAILSMKETGNEIRRFVANNVGKSIKYYIFQTKDKLLSSTYAMAYAMVFRSRDFPEVGAIFLIISNLMALLLSFRARTKKPNLCCKKSSNYGSPSGWNRSRSVSLARRHSAWNHKYTIPT